MSTDSIQQRTSMPPSGTTPRRPIDDRVDALIAAMTLDEKIAQLYGVWVGASAEGGDVAPHQHDMERRRRPRRAAAAGLGQLTRPFGTAPVDPALGALSLVRAQERIVGGEPLRHPGDRARGVPRRLRSLGGDRLPGAAVAGAPPSTPS